RQRVRHRVHAVGQTLPCAGHARHFRLAAELSFRTYFFRDACYFVGENAQAVYHVVHGVLEREHLALRLDGDLLREVAVGDGRRHVGDVSHLRGQVGGEDVHVVGEVAPHTARAGDLRLAAELSFRSYFARHARDFAGEPIELIDHRVDSVLELEDLAAHVDRDLARQIAARHSRG